jgi:hypothetical protein
VPAVSVPTDYVCSETYLTAGASRYPRQLRARRFLTQLIILQDCLQGHDLTSCSPQGVLSTSPLILVERPDRSWFVMFGIGRPQRLAGT